MNMLKLLSGLALLMFGVTAQAHAHLQTAVPVDGSVIAVSPPNIVLILSAPARLTTCSIQKGDEPKQNLDHLPTELAKQISVE